MVTARDISAYLDMLFPPSLSESWDNDGLSVDPCPFADVKTAAVALDLTSATRLTGRVPEKATGAQSARSSSAANSAGGIGDGRSPTRPNGRNANAPVIPAAAARQSFTPPSALSSLVWQETAAMPLLMQRITRFPTLSSALSEESGRNISG